MPRVRTRSGTVTAAPSGSAAAFIGALVFVMTGYGFGWVNAAADYSRYLPRRASTTGVVGWTTFGGALAPVILLITGLLLAGSDAKLSKAMLRYATFTAAGSDDPARAGNTRAALTTRRRVATAGSVSLINPGGFESNWCGATGIVKLSADLTAMTNLK